MLLRPQIVTCSAPGETQQLIQVVQSEKEYGYTSGQSNLNFSVQPACLLSGDFSAVGRDGWKL